MRESGSLFALILQLRPGEFVASVMSPDLLLDPRGHDHLDLLLDDTAADLPLPELFPDHAVAPLTGLQSAGKKGKKTEIIMMI